jgi:hypothetical protein
VAGVVGGVGGLLLLVLMCVVLLAAVLFYLAKRKRKEQQLLLAQQWSEEDEMDEATEMSDMSSSSSSSYAGSYVLRQATRIVAPVRGSHTHTHMYSRRVSREVSLNELETAHISFAPKVLTFGLGPNDRSPVEHELHDILTLTNYGSFLSRSSHSTHIMLAC